MLADCLGTLTCTSPASVLSILSMVSARQDCWLYDLWNGTYVGD